MPRGFFFFETAKQCRAECIGDRLHREASFGFDKSRKLGFFDSDFARASRKILDFHRFAAEHPFKLTEALFEPADLRAPDNWFIIQPLQLRPRSSTGANDTAGWEQRRAVTQPMTRSHRVGSPLPADAMLILPGLALA